MHHASAPFVIVTATTESLRERSRVRVNEAYTNALAAFGIVPLVLPPIDAAAAVAALDGVHGLVLTGGEDVDPRHFGEARHAATGEPHKARDSYELALARSAAHRRMPTLAICRGAQVINVALGGTLVQDIATQVAGAGDHDQANARNDRVHDIAIDADSRLARVVGDTTIRVNSSHHQSVARAAESLRITARGADGVVEALEPADRDWWMLAVQWHPEELTATREQWDRQLFAAFADAARQQRRAPASVPPAPAALDEAQVESRQRASSRT
jgi:putative glutamine amidotransferase